MKACGYCCGVVITLASLACGAVEPETSALELAPLIAHVAGHRDGEAPWSINFASLDGDRSPLPVGVFDSGIGGLTVMEAILRLDAFNNRTLQPGPDGIPDFAGERFVYLGDQANMPYGNYPAKGREDYLHELIVKDAVFLLGARYHSMGGVRSDKPAVKAVVIACNTATAYGLGDIRAALREWKLEVPVVGVVEAGARAVSESLPVEGGGGAVAVLATVGTCNAGAYPRAIERAGGLAGKNIPTMVQQGSVGLAGAIEGNPAFVSTAAKVAKSSASYLGPAVGNPDAPLDPALAGAYDFDPAGVIGDPSKPATWRLNSAANYARYEVTTLVENYRRRGGGPPIATVVLGCTHFPIVEREIAAAFARLREHRAADGTQPFRALVAGKILFANPAEFTAKELFRELARRRLRAAKDSTIPPAIASAFVSVPNPIWPGVKVAADGSFDADFKYSRNAGRPADEDAWIVPFADAPSSLSSLRDLSGALPRVWAALSPPSTGVR
jgi:glutamate racemase